jgi:hypothetical protein
MKIVIRQYCTVQNWCTGWRLEAGHHFTNCSYEMLWYSCIRLTIRNYYYYS